MKKKNNTIRINYFAIVVVVFLFGVLIFRTIYVSYAAKIDGLDIKKFASNRNSTTETLSAARGKIYSIDKKILAEDVNSYTVIAYLSSTRTTKEDDPRHVIDKEYTANVLADYIKMSPEAILKLLNMEAYQVELGPGGRNISERLMREIEALDLPGIDFIQSSKRYYPYGDFASYIIGYAKKYDDETIRGELGVEAYYDDDLKGKDGYTTYQQDIYGYRIADTPVITEEAESGKDVYLTIDTNIQMYLENAVKDLIKNNSTDWVTVTVANAKTGAILGSASNPSYNPNKLDIVNYNNPLVSYAYEPGSTMKIYSFMAAMEEGKYVGESKYNSGVIKIKDDTVYDWNKVGWGSITFNTGFTYSSNVAAVKLAQSIGKKKLLEYYKKFGFGKTTGIEMSNEYSGIVKPVYDIEVANAAFGQGITTTPIQNIQALTSLANDGTILKPYIVDKIVNHDTGEIIYQAEKKTEVEKVVSTETVEKMLDLMYETVNGDDPAATGHVYQTNATTLVGKTGTAQYINEKTGKYYSGTYQNIKSFSGLFPYENPEYLIYISIKDLDGSSNIMGNTVKSIVESIAKYKNLDELVIREDKNKIIEIKNYINKNIDETVDNVKNLGLDVITIGNGKRIINQYPEKGVSLVKGSKIYFLTNSLEFIMPDMHGWTNNEVKTFCNLAETSCTLNGFGTVINQSVTAGSSIYSNSVITFDLNRENNQKVSDEVESEEN